MDSINLSNTGLVVDGLTSLDALVVNSDPCVTSVVCPALKHASQFQVTDNPLLASVSCPLLKAYTGVTNINLSVKNNPLLTTVDLNSLVSSSSAIIVSGNEVLVNLQLGALVFVYRHFSIASNPSLVSLSLPALISAAVAPGFPWYAGGCTNLSSVSCPKYLPTNARGHDFQNAALSESSVDHILSRFIANPLYVSGTINLSGGTSAPPGTQGQLDKATLQARGCIVLTN